MTKFYIYAIEKSLAEKDITEEQEEEFVYQLGILKKRKAELEKI